MSRKLFLIGLLMLSLVGFAGIFPAGAQMTADVTMNSDATGNYFRDVASGTGANNVPAITTITVGGTVTWTNVAGIHTVTAGSPLTGAPPGLCATGDAFDSGFMAAVGQTYSHTFNTPGSCAYFCTLHGFTMTGQVNISVPSPTTTTTTTSTTTTTTKERCQDKHNDKDKKKCKPKHKGKD